MIANLSKPRAALIFVVCIFAGNVARAPAGDDFARHRVELLKWVPREDFSESWALVKGCWGYVSESGREYGMACHTLGTTFFDLADPANPVDIAFVDAPDSDWREIKTHLHYAYIIGESGPGIQVVDLSQIDSGVVTLVKEVTAGGNQPTHSVEINSDSGFLYRCAGGSGFPTYGLRIYDLAVPDDPVFVAEWNDRYVHDAQIVTYHEGPYAGREIAFCSAVDTVGGGNAALDIVDVTDKSNIVRIGQNEYPKGSYAHQGWLSDDRRYFYLNDELDEQNNLIPCTSRIFDVSVLENPVLVNKFHSGTKSTDHNLYPLGRMIFQSNYSCGLRVFDATDPIRPVQVGFFDTRPEDDNAGLIASYSNYPYLPSGIVIGTDRERGFFVWDVDAIWDCDGNGQDDGAEIAANPGLDADENRTLDACQNTLRVPSEYGTIQSAIDAAGMSDLILVADGTYGGAGNFDLDFKGKVLTLKSENGAAATVLDGGGVETVLNFKSGESFGTRVDGFTITGGFGSTGGGMYCLNSGPTVLNCVFAGNSAASSGGAIYSDYGNAVIRNCLITGNTSNGNGGGLYSRGDSTPAFEHCTFNGNTSAVTGGAVYALRGNPKFTDCILWGDTAVNGPELAVVLGSLTINHCLVQGGMAGVYLVTGTIVGGTEIIDADPLFATGPLGSHYLSHTAAGQAADSPAIDAGSMNAAETGLDALTTRSDETFDTGQVDLGYHYPITGLVLPCAGDANGDGTVDPLDSGFVLSRFGCVVGAGDADCDSSDQNADGAVDPLDVGYVLSRFGTCG